MAVKSIAVCKATKFESQRYLSAITSIDVEGRVSPEKWYKKIWYDLQIIIISLLCIISSVGPTYILCENSLGSLRLSWQP